MTRDHHMITRISFLISLSVLFSAALQAQEAFLVKEAQRPRSFSTLPGGMETTVKIKIADQILSSVVFGAIDYETDQKIRFSISGAGILLISRHSGQLLASGRISIQ